MLEIPFKDAAEAGTELSCFSQHIDSRVHHLLSKPDIYVRDLAHSIKGRGRWGVAIWLEACLMQHRDAWALKLLRLCFCSGNHVRSIC